MGWPPPFSGPTVQPSLPKEWVLEGFGHLDGTKGSASVEEGRNQFGWRREEN